ncbi:hypothetical protein [Isoptericola sp. QY 916]|uniref:hypothetical protein n=1 Tax=Isoptericola sp. QY 916 TaxID=2782570 RepID=UPI003D2F9E87|nr:hypothetical protein [Isoptericola sp. QY 916]
MSAAHDIDELLKEHAPTNSLAALAATTPCDDDGEPDLASQGEERTAGALRVNTSTAGRAARHPLGVAMVLALALAAVYLAVVVAWLSPQHSGGHLIASPLLVVFGGALVYRLARTQYRRSPMNTPTESPAQVDALAPTAAADAGELVHRLCTTCWPNYAARIGERFALCGTDMHYEREVASDGAAVPCGQCETVAATHQHGGVR